MDKNELLKLILADQDIKKLINDEKIPMEQVEQDYLVLYAYYINKNKCNLCRSLKECCQDNLGDKPVLVYNGRFNLEYQLCKYMEKVKDNIDKANNLIVVGTSLDNIDTKDIYINQERNQLLLKLNTIFQNFLANKKPKGLYINGPYGCGKSYIMGAFAKQFAEKGASVIFAYFPDLIRKIKSMITEGGLEAIVDDMKECDVLILDDFGGELISPFVRDEILGAVLQERMENKRLTFITTNLDFEILHNHLSESTKDIDDMRASRIEKRIETLMEKIDLKDKNYR